MRLCEALKVGTRVHHSNTNRLSYINLDQSQRGVMGLQSVLTIPSAIFEA